MRTVAQETALQIALRNCSKEAGPPDSVCVILVKGGGGVRAITHMFLQKLAASLMGLLLVTRNRPPHGRFSCSSRYEETQETGLIKSSPENICLKAYPASFSQSTERLIPDLHPELLSGHTEGQQWQRARPHPRRDRWRVTSFSQCNLITEVLKESTDILLHLISLKIVTFLFGKHSEFLCMLQGMKSPSVFSLNTATGTGHGEQEAL